MNTYAVVGYLDSKTETYFKDLWINLSDRNISKYGVEAKGKRPHITIALNYIIGMIIPCIFLVGGVHIVLLQVD